MSDQKDTSPKKDILGFMRKHLEEYLETDGKEGHLRNGNTCLVLNTVGRTSGEARQAALIYGEYDGSYIVVASRGGSSRSPAWYHNMMATDSVHIQVLAKKMKVKPRVVSDDERARLWDKMAAAFPDYNDYQKRTSRQIPVVVLDPL